MKLRSALMSQRLMTWRIVCSPWVPIAGMLWQSWRFQRLPTIWKSRHTGGNCYYHFSEKFNRSFACGSIKKTMIIVLLPLILSLKLVSDPVRGNWLGLGCRPHLAGLTRNLTMRLTGQLLELYWDNLSLLFLSGVAIRLGNSNRLAHFVGS